MVKHKRGIMIALAVAILLVFIVGFWLRGRHLEVYEQESSEEETQELAPPLTLPSLPQPGTPPAQSAPAPPDTTTNPTP